MSRYFKLNNIKRGFSSQRYCFTAVESTGNDEVSFILELNAVNPLLSPDKCVYSLVRQTFRSKEDFERDEHVIREILNEEILTKPSYVAVHLVMLGKNAKEFTVFAPYKDVKIDKKGTELNFVGCYFSLNRLKGRMECERNKWVEWDLKYEIETACEKGFKGKHEKWLPFGSRSVFQGVLRLDGKNYIVHSRRSFGYIDRNFSMCCDTDYFHLSSSCITSMITRKILDSSFFVAHGIYSDKLSFLSNIDGKILNFLPNQFFNRYTSTQACLPMPNSENDDRVHWTMSLHTNVYIIDVDVFCKESDMFMRVLEDVQDGKRVRKIFSSHSGRGELKIYRNIKKSLELLEHVRIDKVLCEYGKIESVS